MRVLLQVRASKTTKNSDNGSSKRCALRRGDRAAASGTFFFPNDPCLMAQRSKKGVGWFLIRSLLFSFSVVFFGCQQSQAWSNDYFATVCCFSTSFYFATFLGTFYRSKQQQQHQQKRVWRKQGVALSLTRTWSEYFLSFLNNWSRHDRWRLKKKMEGRRSSSTPEDCF